MQDLPAAPVPVTAVVGDKGICPNGACEGGFHRLQREFGPVHPLLSGGGEGSDAAALEGDPGHIHLADSQSIRKAALRQDGPVFRNQIVTREDHVGRRLAVPGVRI